VVVNGGYAVAISGTIGGPSAKPDLYFASLSGAGALVGSVVHVTTGLYAEDTPALASSGNGFGLVWKDTRDGDPHIYFVELDGAGKAKGAEKRISGGTVNAEYPSIVWTGSGYAAAWRQTVGVTDSNQVVKVDPTGNIVAGPVAANPKTGTSHKLEGPALTWNGQLLGVAFPWVNPIDGITFVELDETLTQRSTFATFVPDAVGAGGRYPSLVSDADGYTLAWSGSPTYEIFATHITCK
ncbi:MAG: toxin, partial [Labilithrix sp.]|nr:toxin [Labilithrix sp.]